MLILALGTNNAVGCQTQTISIGVHTNYQPNVSLSRPILVNAATWLSLANFHMTFHHAPVARVIKHGATTPNHLIIPIYRTAAREKLFH